MTGTPPPELDSRPQSRREWSGHLGSLVLPLGLVVALVAGLLYLQSRGGGAADESGLGTVELPQALNATGESPSPTEGRAAPDFILQDLDGNDLRFSDLQGSPVVVSFWAGWCSSCRSQLVALTEALDARPDADLRVLGVNLRESADQAAAFADDFGLPFPVLLDSSGEVSRTWRIDGPDGGVPATYFIDARGVVRQVGFGALSDDSLEQGLSLILEGEN